MGLLEKVLSKPAKELTKTALNTAERAKKENRLVTDEITNDRGMKIKVLGLLIKGQEEYEDRVVLGFNCPMECFDPWMK